MVVAIQPQPFPPPQFIHPLPPPQFIHPLPPPQFIHPLPHHNSFTPLLHHNSFTPLLHQNLFTHSSTPIHFSYHRHRAVPPRVGLPEVTVKLLLRQMTEAILFVHSNNIVHRDLKLENFLVFQVCVCWRK